MRCFPTAATLVVGLFAFGCASEANPPADRPAGTIPVGTDGSPPALEGAAIAFHQEYQRRLRSAPGSEVARLYHVGGAQVVIDGVDDQVALVTK